MSIMSDLTSAVQFRLMDADRLGLTEDEPDESKGEQDEDYRPSWETGAYDPTQDKEAYWLGYELALDGDMVDSDALDAHRDAVERAAFRVGQSIGLIERHRVEDMEREAQILHEERLEEAFGEPGLDWHHSERVEAIGVIEARLA